MAGLGISIALGLLCISSAACAQDASVLEEKSHQADFRLVQVAGELSSPWSLEFLPDGDILVTEWPGNLRRIRDGVVSDPISGMPAVVKRGEETGGLLTVTIDPDFETNRTIYLCYLHGSYDSNVSRIAKAELRGGALVNLKVIFEGNDRAEEFNHSGCRFVWAEDDTLFVTFGDRRYLPEESQNLKSTTGSIIRINKDGSPAADNPFLKGDGRPEIWAYGVRNVQGAAVNPASGEIWFSEHGPLGGDEVNILKRGANYGWPLATYGIDYDGSVITEDAQLPDIEGPVVYWRPSTAPSGLAFYTGDDFPNWRGDLFMGSLADKRLIRMELDGARVLFQ